MLLIIRENEKTEQNVFYVLSVREIAPRVHCKIEIRRFEDKDAANIRYIRRFNNDT